MDFTPLVLLFAFLVFWLDWHGHRLGGLLFVFWITSIFTSVSWGIYISRRKRFWGGFCVAVGLMMLSSLFLPSIG